jgi:hypothetical protein
VAWTADHRGSTPPKSFFESLPRELEEAAQIDGLGWFGIFVRIVLPLSKAVLATMILFYAVSYWNDWFTAFLYLDNNNLFPLSLFLRNLIAGASTTTALLPRQSQIWAVLRTQDSPQRLAYSLTATMLGRMCLSGEIYELSDEQWAVVSRAISFYRSAVPVIKNGVSHRFGPKVRSYRHPEGWQAVRRLSNDGAQILVVAHRFGAAERTPIEVPLPPGRYEVSDLYSHREIVVKLTEELVAVELDEPFSAAALVLTQIE